MKTLSIALLNISLLFVAPAHATINLGTAGDSLTDEYLASSPGDRSGLNLAAKSWVQILAQTRASTFNFGAYKPDPDDNWGGSRDTGYEYNYAKSGAVAANNTFIQLDYPGRGNNPYAKASIAASGSSYLQTEINGDTDGIGLAGQISAGKVSTVYIGIGSNDFLFRTNAFDISGTGASTPIPLANLNLGALVTDVTSGIVGAIDTLFAAKPTDGNLHMLVGLLRTRDAANSDARSQALAAAVDQINANLIAHVASLHDAGKQVATVDLFGWTTDPNDPHHYNADGTINIGDLVITPTAVSTDPLAGDLVPAGTPGASTLCNAQGMCASRQNATHATTEPQPHPNTLIQALMANEIIDGLNNLGENIQPLSDQEILAIPQYTSAVPLPGSAWLFGSALLCATGLRRKRATQ